MPPTQQPTLRIQNTTAFPLEVVVPSPQQATTIATAVAARGAAQLPPSTVSSSRRSAVSIWVTRADGETLVFTEDRKRRKRGGEGWSAMVLTPSGTGSAAASAASYGHPSDSTSTLDDALPKPSWPLKAFFHKASHAVTLISTPPLHSWMSALPDDFSLGDVMLPGTHQSTALYGFPISQCQQPSTPLAVQLQDGIRFLDVRLAEKNGKLIAYHGILTQRANFGDLLAQVKAFLTAPESSRETVVMSIQQENATTPLFLSLLHEYVAASPPALWFLANRIPSVAEARGKIVLFSRFGGAGTGWEALGGMGIHPVGWKDSVRDGFELELPDRGQGGGQPGEVGWGWTLGIQDWYNIGSVLSIPEKAAAVVSLLSRETPQAEHVGLAFASAASFPLACPVYVARGFGWSAFGVAGVNARLGRWLLERLSLAGGGSNGDGANEKASSLASSDHALRGWLLFDFYRSEPGLIDLVVAFNYV